jgi:hypothetical protein
MKKSIKLFALVLMFAMAAAAHDIPKMETFLGYTYVRASSTSKFPAYSANGGGGQFAYNFNPYVSVVADIGAAHNSSIGGNRIDNTAANFLFGPRISFRYPRIRPYFQLLFGGVYLAASSELSALVAGPSPPLFLPGLPAPAPGQAVTVRVATHQTAFAMMAGGGLDISINKHVSFRPIGLDYYLTRLQNLRTQNDNNQNNLRYTTGFNFTFGAQ